MTTLAKRLRISKRDGALLGAFLVFSGSAWMHWQGATTPLFRFVLFPLGEAPSG